LLTFSGLVLSVLSVCFRGKKQLLISLFSCLFVAKRY